MTKTFFSVPFMLISLVALLSGCSKTDTEHTDPPGTIVIDLYDENNGGTRFPGADIFIDKDHFFNTGLDIHWECFSNLGKRKGLGGISGIAFKELFKNIEVIPGYAYQFFPNGIWRFDSGAVAVMAGSEYYNVYVVNDIIDNGGNKIGATVKYVACKPDSHGLPSGDDRFIGTLSHENKSITVEFPVADFEYYIFDSGYISVNKEGKKLIVTADRFDNDIPFDPWFLIFIRVEHSYTTLSGTVLTTMTDLP